MPREKATPLDELLKWVNATESRALAPDRAARVVDRFVRSFDGGPGAGFVRADVRSDERIAGIGLDAKGRVRVSADRIGPNPYRFFVDDADELAHLHTHLASAFARLFRREPGYDAPIFEDVDEGRIPLSLSFGLDTQRSGRRVMRVAGARFDLVLYLVSHLLATSETTIGRCPAPRPWPYSKERCGRYFIIARGTRGKPRKYCVETNGVCRDRWRTQNKPRRK